MPKTIDIVALQANNGALWNATGVLLDIHGTYKRWFYTYIMCNDEALYNEVDEILEGTMGINGEQLDTFDRVRTFMYLTLMYGCDAITEQEDRGEVYTPKPRLVILRKKGNRSNEGENNAGDVQEQ